MAGEMHESDNPVGKIFDKVFRHNFSAKSVSDLLQAGGIVSDPGMEMFHAKQIAPYGIASRAVPRP